MLWEKKQNRSKMDLMKYLYAVCLLLYLCYHSSMNVNIRSTVSFFVSRCNGITVQNIFDWIKCKSRFNHSFISYSSMRLFAKLPYESQLFHRNEWNESLLEVAATAASVSASTANLLKRNAMQKIEGIFEIQCGRIEAPNKIVLEMRTNCNLSKN